MSAADDKRAALIAGLRELADFLEQHPDLPISGYPALSIHPTGTTDAEGIAVVEAYAAALDVEVDRSYHVIAARQFGPLEFRAVKVLNQSTKEFNARQKIADAAAWVLVCDAGHLPTSTTYATEQAANAVLAMHATACAGGHTVHLVSPAPTGELVQA